MGKNKKVKTQPRKAEQSAALLREVEASPHKSKTFHEVPRVAPISCRAKGDLTRFQKYHRIKHFFEKQLFR